MYLLLRLVACTLLLTAVSVKVRAQVDDPISVDTKVVNILVSVTDRNGKPVEGLARSDFELFDNKKKADIAFFSNQDVPISYGIVYDLHPTTSDQTKAILRSLEAFTGRMGKNEDYSLTVFNEYGSLNVNFIPTSEQIARHLSFGDRNEPNSLYDAVIFAGKKLQSRPNQKRILIIISDGKDHQSHHKFSELERLLKSFSVQIYGVILDEKDVWDYDALSINGDVIRSNIDETELNKAAIRALSRGTGGSTSEPQGRNEIELYKIFERISSETRGSYSIGFYPETSGIHNLEIKVNQNGRKFKLSYRKSIQVSNEQ